MKKGQTSASRVFIRNIIGILLAIIIPFAYFILRIVNGLRHSRPQLDSELCTAMVIMIFISLACALDKSVTMLLNIVFWLEAVLLTLNLIGMYFGFYVIN